MLSDCPLMSQCGYYSITVCTTVCTAVCTTVCTTVCITSSIKIGCDIIASNVHVEHPLSMVEAMMTIHDHWPCTSLRMVVTSAAHNHIWEVSHVSSLSTIQSLILDGWKKLTTMNCLQLLEGQVHSEPEPVCHGITYTCISICKEHNSAMEWRRNDL